MELKYVMSLFDGHSCGQIALNYANITFEKYFASEINPHMIKVTNTKFIISLLNHSKTVFL